VTPVSERDVYEVALLCGGAPRVALAAVAIMPRAGRITISRTPHRVQVVHCGAGQPAGRAVLDALPDSGKVPGPVFQDIARPAAVQDPDLPQLAVTGHLPLVAARTAGPFLTRPGPAPSMVWAAAGTKVPAGSSPKTPAPAVSGEPSSAGGRESPAGGARAGGAGDGTGAGTGGSAGSTGAGSPPTGTVTAPVGPMPTPTLPTGVLSTTLGGLTGGGSHPPPVIGSGTGSGSAGSLTGTLSGIAGLLGHS